VVLSKETELKSILAHTIQIRNLIWQKLSLFKLLSQNLSPFGINLQKGVSIQKEKLGDKSEGKQ